MQLRIDSSNCPRWFHLSIVTWVVGRKILDSTGEEDLHQRHQYEANQRGKGKDLQRCTLPVAEVHFRPLHRFGGQRQHTYYGSQVVINIGLNLSQTRFNGLSFLFIPRFRSCSMYPQAQWHCLQTMPASIIRPSQTGIERGRSAPAGRLLPINENGILEKYDEWIH